MILISQDLVTKKNKTKNASGMKNKGGKNQSKMGFGL